MLVKKIKQNISKHYFVLFWFTIILSGLNFISHKAQQMDVSMLLMTTVKLMWPLTSLILFVDPGGPGGPREDQACWHISPCLCEELQTQQCNVCRGDNN